MQQKWGKDLVNDKCYNPNYSLNWDFVLDRKDEDE